MGWRVDMVKACLLELLSGDVVPACVCRSGDALYSTSTVLRSGRRLEVGGDESNLLGRAILACRDLTWISRL